MSASSYWGMLIEQLCYLPSLLWQWIDHLCLCLCSPVSSSFLYFLLPGGGPRPRLHRGVLPGPPAFPLWRWMWCVCGPGQTWTLGGWRRRSPGWARGGPRQSGRGPGLPSTGDQLQGPGADQGRTWERHHHFLWPAARKREPGLLCGSRHGK